MNLYQQIKKYSNLKSCTILPASILAILSLISIGVQLILSLWNYKIEWFYYTSSVTLMIGVLLPPISLIISEKKRRSLIDPSNKKVISYFKLISTHDITGFFLGGDIVDLFFSTIVMHYQEKSVEGESILDAVVNSLRYICRENRNKDLDIIKFAYRNPKSFSSLCSYILDNILNNDDVQQLEVHNLILNKYSDLLEVDDSKANKIITFENFRRLYPNIKIALLIGGVIMYFNPNNSWYFNLVALLLLVLEVSDGKKNE